MSYEWGEGMSHTNFTEIVKLLPEELRRTIKTISFQALDEAAKNFVHTVGLRFKSAEWLNDYFPPDFLLHGDVAHFSMDEALHDTTHFTPFVEKALIEQGDKICIIGDVHADLGYLVTILAELQRQGYLDKDYRLIDPSMHIAFVGDYTNRNHHSVEVMLTLFYLYRRNVDRVFLLRGNHEYAISVRVVYEIYQTLMSDHSDTKPHNGLKDAFIAEISRKLHVYRFPDLLYWFDFLPMSLYIGCYDDTHNRFNYINVCHGGIEPGYLPNEFLTSSARFERIAQLKRYEIMQQLIADEVIPDAAPVLTHAFENLHKKGLVEFVESFIKHDHVVSLTNRHNPRHLRLGMQWNSFLTESNNAIHLASSSKHRNLLFGKELTNYFFDRASNASHRVVSMIRGHQHLDDSDDSMGLNSPMLSLLRQQQGIVRQWNGAVYTMGDGGSATTWQAFMIVSTGKNLSDWQARHYFKRENDVEFECKMTSFCS